MGSIYNPPPTVGASVSVGELDFDPATQAELETEIAALKAGSTTRVFINEAADLSKARPTGWGAVEWVITKAELAGETPTHYSEAGHDTIIAAAE